MDSPLGRQVSRVMELGELSEAEQFLLVLLCRRKYVRGSLIQYQDLQRMPALRKKMRPDERLDGVLTNLYKLDLVNYAKMQDKKWWISLTVDLGLPLAVHLWGKIARGGRVRDVGRQS